MNQLQYRAADMSTLHKILLTVSFHCVYRNSLNAAILIWDYVYQTDIFISKNIVIKGKQEKYNTRSW